MDMLCTYFTHLTWSLLAEIRSNAENKSQKTEAIVKRKDKKVESPQTASKDLMQAFP